MRKLFTAVVSALLISSSLFAQEHLKFKGREIDGSLKDFEVFLVESGFNLTIEDHWFEGDFAGMKECLVRVASMKKSDDIWKVIIITPNYETWSELESKYKSLKASYTEKYGTPEVYEFFSS